MLDWCGFFLIVCSVFCYGSSKKLGGATGAMGSACLIIWGLQTETYSAALANVLFFVLNVRNARLPEPYDVIGSIAKLYKRFDFIPEKMSDELYKQRLYFLFEEVNEYEYAEEVLLLGHPLIDLNKLKNDINASTVTPWPNFGEQFDALIDVSVYAIGTALQQKFPVQKGFEKVIEANSKKELSYDSAGEKIMVKPDGWEPPNLNEVLK